MSLRCYPLFNPQREKYELSSELLSAKNEAAELEIKLHEAEQQAQARKEEAENAKRERDDMQVRACPL